MKQLSHKNAQKRSTTPAVLLRITKRGGFADLHCISEAGSSLRFRVLGLAISASIDKICVFYGQLVNTLGVGDIEFCV